MDITEKDKDLKYFGAMLENSGTLVDKASQPWKTAVVCLVVAVAVCIAGWALSVVSMSNRHMDTIDALVEHIVTLECGGG